ncbi:hypothetical protein BDW22DRAFT_1314272, partial [Trametopsis cervina]
LQDGLLVKYGSFVGMTEVHNALYVLKHSTIATPDIHLVFSCNCMTYIMDYIPCESLLHRWTTLSEADRSSILAQLKEYLDQLRNLRSPTPGPVDGSRWKGPWFTFYGKDPFATYADFVAWLNRMLRLSKADGIVEAFSEAYPLVFTHQDISPRNLILDNSGKLWVIDWEQAGWYP